MSEPTPSPEPAAPPPPSGDEDLYQAAVAVIAEPETAGALWLGLGCLFAALVLFALALIWPDHLRSLAFIVPILFLHEAGHWLGMRALGWRNPRVFFIPLFG